MARDTYTKGGHLRDRIAHLAARIMAEDGVDDFAYAKRKAARQAGARDAKAMPDNQEIEQALALYRSIYRKDDHPQILGLLRERALTVMRMLEAFRPQLTGSVLSGVAGRNSDIEVQAYADSAKEVEIFLLTRGVRFWPAQSRLYINNQETVVPTYTFEHDGAEVRVTALDARDLRHVIRTTPGGRPLERAPIPAVEALLREP
jgi:hypothetical protein